MNSSTGIAESTESLPLFRRGLILVTVVMGATLYVTTMLVASTVLPQMQGAMSATPKFASVLHFCEVRQT